ncbi:MAG TPA: class I SAM-dependent methyltransferase [Polyangia bacterium]|nr:class I SAM-dependent methyltransferase [Polyangia bacterium]
MSGADLPGLLREAEAHLRVGRFDEADRVCEQLMAGPPHPQALLLVSLVRIGQQRLMEADALLAGAIRLYPTLAAFPAALARLRLQMQRWNEAVEPLEACVLLEPASRDHRAILAAVYQGRLFTAFSDGAKRCMLALLADDSLAHSAFAPAWLSLLRLDPDSAPLLEALAMPDAATFSRRMTVELLEEWQANELFTKALTRFTIPDRLIERGLGLARGWLFDQVSSAREGPTIVDRYLPLICRLARAFFMSEYVLPPSEDVAPLRRSLETAGRVALLACYEPLWTLDGAAGLGTLSDDVAYRELLRVQVAEPLEEQALATGVIAKSPIDDDVSRAVKAQYEESPYPRWVTAGVHREVPLPVRALAVGKRILVAGCGTGREAIEAALIFPAAHVTGVDLSRRSLAYALRQSRQRGIGNLELYQADILRIEQVGAGWDFIVCAGVLHHMRDPAEGLRALASVLAPYGVLRVGLYSRTGRAPVLAARDWIAREKFAPTPDGIRAFRAALLARPDGDPLKDSLTRSADFYSLSACRDLLFHAHEQSFTFPELAATFGIVGLAVLQVDTKLPAHRALYGQRFPDDLTATSLHNWHVLEQENPTMFAGLTSLWLCRAADRARVDVDWIRRTQALT